MTVKICKGTFEQEEDTDTIIYRYENLLIIRYLLKNIIKFIT